MKNLVRDLITIYQLASVGAIVALDTPDSATIAKARSIPPPSGAT